MYTEVTQDVGYSEQTVKKIKDEAIDEGIFTEEEYQNARKERKEKLKSEPKKTRGENKELEYQVLELLKNGKKMYFIRKKTGASKADVQAIIKQLIKEGEITQNEIDEARNKAAKEAERKILIGLRRGFTQQEIAEMFEDSEYSVTAIQERIEKLKERGEITEEEIERYKYEAEQGDKETFEFVQRGMKQGFSIAMMAQSDENGYYTEAKIKNTIKRMKKRGILTEKDIEKWRKIRKKSKQKQSQKARKKKDKEIIRFLLQGLTAKEIGEQLGFLEKTVHENIARIKQDGKITQDEIANARKIKKEKDAKQQKQEDEKDIENYKTNLELALKILNANDDKYTDKLINKTVQELLSLAEKMQAKGLLKSEELKIISELLFQPEKVEVNNVLELARLYLRMKNYQTSIYILNYSRDFFVKEEDLQKINRAVKTVGIYKRKMEAAQMLDKGYSLEIIEQRTQLSLAEIINLKNRKAQKQQKGSKSKKTTYSQGDDEFPDL